MVADDINELQQRVVELEEELEARTELLRQLIACFPQTLSKDKMDCMMAMAKAKNLKEIESIQAKHPRLVWADSEELT